MSQPSIFQRFTDNALAAIGAAVNATPTPADTYDADVLLRHRPASRVLWDAASPNTVALQFAWPIAQEIALIVLPVFNATDGSVTATTPSGLNIALPAATLRGSGMSRTMAQRVADLDSDVSHRTTDELTLTFSGQTAGLLLGGFIGLYGPERSFIDRDFRWGFTKQPIGYQVDHENQAGVDYVSSYDTQAAVYTLSTLASEDDREAIEDWLDANIVGGYPCFIWVDPDGRNLPLVCRVIGQPSITDVFSEGEPTGAKGAIEIAITVKELTKGEPLT